MIINAIIQIKRLRLFIPTILGVLLLVTSQYAASAEIKIQIGGNEAEYKALLARDGYDRITTRKIGLAESQFDACKDGRRYRIEFEWTGNIKTKAIGDCRKTITENAAKKIMTNRGFTRVTIEDRAGKYLAIGCLRDLRYRVEMNYYGDAVQEKRIGRCAEALSPEDVMAKLEAEGYTRITFVSRRLPEYRAEACFKNDLLELIIDGNGEFIRNKKVGNCRAELPNNQIVKIMEEKGYTEVMVIDPNLPRYLAQGCRDGNMMEVTLNRWGEVSNEVRIGRCQTGISEDEIERAMAENGYRNVSVRKSGSNYVSRGCKDNRYEEITLSQAGSLVNRTTLGNCNAPKINDLAETLRKRGLSRLQFFVEACENRQRIRISFDEFANRTGNEVIGKC